MVIDPLHCDHRHGPHRTMQRILENVCDRSFTLLLGWS